MRALARLLLLAALPALAGRGGCAGEVLSVTEGGAGAGPEFVRGPTTLVAAVGSDAALECRVLRQGDKAVSWVRSRDLQILSHAGAVFTADARVAAAAARAGAVSRHTLRLRGLRAADAGRYECQLNTEPKMSLFYNLTVVDEPMPVVVISAVDGRAVRGAAGGAATLACDARYEPAPRELPLPPLDVRWTKDGQPLNLQSSRGGVSLDTERWAARARSRLTLAGLRAADAGAYTCAAGDVADAVYLHVDAESPIEAMQRDQSASDGSSDLQRHTFWAVTLGVLLLRTLLNT
ncbi:hemicentin-2-like [Ostrinia furnacalis]|uniref:hemicentin-2-like n=1 Tax=Ostrinia furnacalis TaxID=93504 RepID=UPI00103E6AE8|nr:hemicentin-2-like [Ostrinia furnacalis]